MRRFQLLFFGLLMAVGLNAQTLIQETFDSGIPADWTNLNPDADSYEFKSPAQYAVGGTTTYAAAMGCDNDYLITPQLNISSADFVLSYDVGVENTSYAYSFKVMVSTTDTDPASFTEIHDEVDFATTGWNNNEISLAAYDGQDIYVAFYVYAAGATFYSFGFDNIEVSAPLSNELSADDLDISPSTVFDGDEVTFTANVTNSGSNAQADVIVDFTVDGSSIGTQTIASIASGTSETASLTWTATEGTFDVGFSLPSDDFNDNNEFTTSLTAFNSDALVEGFEGTWLPTGWSVDPETSTWSLGTFGAYEGSQCAYISQDGEKRLITPKLDLTSASTISFYGKSYSGTPTLKLQYSTDKTSWTDVPSGSYTLSGSYEQKNIDLSAIPSGEYYIAFHYDLSWVGVGIDNIVGPGEVAETPLEAENPTPSDAATGVAEDISLEWTANGAGGIPSGYKVYFGTDGAGASTPTNIENGTEQSETTYTPGSALDYETTYYWQIVPTNSEGDAASCPIWSFTTEANPVQPIPYSENFEAVADYGLPTNWSNNFTYSVKSDHGVSSSKGLSVLMWSSTSLAEVTTNAIGPLSSNGNQILFEYRIVDNNDYPNSPTTLGASDKLDVKVSTDDGSTFTTVHTIDQSNHVASSDFATTTINLDAAYNNETIKVKLVSTWNEGEYFIDIDNMEVREAAADPDLLAGANELIFSNVPVSLAHTQTLNILNDGGGTLEITDGDITFTGTDAADFSLGTVTYPIQLGAGESIDLDVIYTANSAGSKSATMDIVNNGVSGTASIALTATSYDLFGSYSQDFETTTADAMPEKWAEISTGLNWAGVLDNESEAFSPTKYLLLTNGTETTGDLFAVTPGFDIGSSRLVFMAKRNNYVSTLSIGTMSDPSDAATFNEIQSIDLTETYTEYEVDFSSYSGTDVYVAFKHNLENTYSEIFIDDVIWEDVPTTPICEVSTTNINFGDAALNEADSESFTITNAGVGTLTINDGDFAFSGTNSEEFSVDGATYPIELAADESVEITLNFAPQAAGSRTATLEIIHNGNNSPTSINLSGNGYDGMVEDFNGAFPPNGWTADDAWNALTFSTYEGDGGAWFNPGSEVTEAKLISPKLAVEDGDVFSFFAKKSNNDGVLKVMYAEDTASKSWTELNSFTITNTEYEEKTTTLSLDGDYFIAIAGSGEAFTSTYVDFIKGPNLSKTYSTTFTVTNNETGSPVSGAEINIEGNILNTDASGLAVVNLENGTYTYTITATGYFEQSNSVTVDNAPAEVAVSLVPVSGYTVTFTINDDITTDPIEGATIDIEGTTITTDPSGLAAIELENGTYNYTVSATDYVEETGSLTVNDATESISVALTPIEETTATFTVTDENGTAIQGAEIDINNTTLTTDASGIASIVLDDGTYEYTVTATDYAPVTDNLTISGADVDVTVELPSVYELTFIVNNEAGDPIEGAFVVIGENFFNTDENGEVTVDAVNGTYYYTVTKADFEMLSGEVTVDGADVTETVTLRMVYFVYFTVNDEDDNPIEGATVTIEDSTLTTTASGETQIELPNGTYAVSISKDGYETVADEFTVQNAGLDISVTLPMVQNDYTVTFNVTDDEANVLEGAEVSFTDGTDTWTAVTDASGVATFNNIVNGDYDYTVTKTDFENTTGSLTVADEDISIDVAMEPVGISSTTPANFNLYPNPTKGKVQIRFEGAYNVVVMNSVGQVIMTREMQNNSTIDLTNKADGIYFIRIQNATNLFTKQVVVE